MEQYPEVVDVLSRISIDWEKLSQGFIDLAQNSMSGVLNSTLDLASSIIGGVVGSVVAIVFAAYILLQKERLGRQFRQLLYAFLPEHHADRITEVGTLSYRTFSRFLSGQCLEAVILGCMFFLTMSILRFPYALTIDPMQALWFVILFLILQQVEGNLIYPHVVGSSVGLPSIWVLAAVTIGGSVMGIAGMLIFIPLCSVFYTLLRHSVLNRLRARKIPQEKILFPKKLSDITFVRHGKAPVVDGPPESDGADWDEETEPAGEQQTQEETEEETEEQPDSPEAPAQETEQAGEQDETKEAGEKKP